MFYSIYETKITNISLTCVWAIGIPFPKLRPKNPKGNAPIPNEKFIFPPNGFAKAPFPLLSGSGLVPAGLGGTSFFLGSFDSLIIVKKFMF